MKYKQYRQPTRWKNNGLLIIPVSSTCFGQLFCPSSTSWVHYTTSCNTQSSDPEHGQNNFPKHVELTGIINKPLLNLVGCLYYLYQCRTEKQISDNEIYLLIKYIKSVLWRVAKRLFYIEDARCLKVNEEPNLSMFLHYAVMKIPIICCIPNPNQQHKFI